MNIPPIDLGRARSRFAAELEERWRKVLASSAFVGGPEVQEFEAAFADYLGAAGCVGVGNGTDALVVALRALDLQPGDEVIVPAFSFFATAECVILAGGVPVFADVEEATLNLDVADAARRVGERTVGIIAVPLYGRPYDVDATLELCREADLWLVEDAAQAHGALWGERRMGTFGSLAAWSFYPTKNLGCFGDGGAITGQDEALVAKARLLANHGMEGRYNHVAVGTNSRLDSLQAAVLNCRLPHLDADNARRREIARRYAAAFEGLGNLRLLEDHPGTTPVYHQFTLRTGRRDALSQALVEQGVRAMIHYPSALHQQPAMADSGAAGSLPVAEAAGAEVLCLPIFPELEDAEVEAVIAAVRDFFQA